MLRARFVFLRGSLADFDLAIIGGGINGAGIARDAAGRGLSVLLVEQNDLASGTSSASTKLIHGGLRYLEHAAFRLVREALVEREVLLHMAPHIVRPLRFVLPAEPGARPAWILRLGLFIYDHLGGREVLPATRTLNLARDPVGAPLKGGLRWGFEYSDCWVDDARLVVLNALDASERGAVIRTRTRCVDAARNPVWMLTLDAAGRSETASARVLINAAGPWVGEVARSVLKRPGGAPVRLIKGSHIVVRRLFDHDRAYIFQSADDRIVFAIPYESGFTLIGTTDTEYAGDPGSVAASAEEIDYLCRAVSGYFRTPVEPQHVVSTFAGVRSLYDDGSASPKDISRDYHLTLDEAPDAPPLLTIYSGKITTYRRLAEAALGRLAHCFAEKPEWTDGPPLPGGDLAVDGIEAFIARSRRRWPFLTETHARRLVLAYGTRIDRILRKAQTLDELGVRFGADLTEAEVRYLMRHEWAMTAEDVLWRRSKLGLQFSPEEKEKLEAFMANPVITMTEEDRIKSDP
jgi:glycerol-3-phosphate dehydrogenase